MGQDDGEERRTKEKGRRKKDEDEGWTMKDEGLRKKDAEGSRVSHHLSLLMGRHQTLQKIIRS